MRRFRFTIAQLATFVVFVAVAAAALREASELWDGAVFTLVLGLLVTSVVLAIHRAGARRAFWLGFAVVGSAYLGASLVPAIAPRLLTTKGLAYLDSKTQRQTVFQRVLLRWPQAFSVWASSGHPQQAVAADLSQSWTGADVLYTTLAAGTVSSGSIGTTENFLRIGHSLIAAVLAFVGGCLSRRLFVGRSSPGESQRTGDDTPSRLTGEG